SASRRTCPVWELRFRSTHFLEQSGIVERQHKRVLPSRAFLEPHLIGFVPAGVAGHELVGIPTAVQEFAVSRARAYPPTFLVEEVAPVLGTLQQHGSMLRIADCRGKTRDSKICVRIFQRDRRRVLLIL